MVKLSTSFFVFFDELRRSLKMLGIALAVMTVVFFFLSSWTIAAMQSHLGEKLYFFSVAGPFLAHVKVAFFAAVYALMPLCMHIVWKALGKPFGFTARQLFWFVLATCLLFYSGTVFCYMLTLPYGIAFLLSFQSHDLQAVISISRFVNFVSLFILAFGLVFELPVFMIFSAKVGVVSRKAYEKNRRYAILVIAILAAILTPTPDLFNMALMGVPLYLLYEIGIILIRVLGVEKTAGGQQTVQEQPREQS